MPQIGPMEIMLVMVVALLVFGPEKLPEMARNLGRTASQLRRMAQDMKDDFSTALDDDEEDRPAPGSASTRPRAAGALPGENDSAEDSAGQADEPTSGHDSAEDAAADDSVADEKGDERPTLHDATADDSDTAREDDEGSSIEASAKDGSGAEAEDDESFSIKDSARGGSGAEAEVNKSSSSQASARGGSEATSEDESSSIKASARGGSEATSEDESSSIKDDLERLNRQQQDAEAAATAAPIEDSKIEGRE